MHEYLIRRFEAAGLRLELTDRAFVPGVSSQDIVQIDIQRKVKGNLRHEWFRIFPGHEDNRIEVVGTDKRIGQVVLMVHEPPRDFEEQVPYSTLAHLQQRDPLNWLDLLCQENRVRKTDVTVRKGKNGRALAVTVKRKTSSRKRHFLMGLDERQLFIAQLPKAVSTVRDAHASLKSPTVILADGRHERTTRQGEWFFLKPSDDEVARIEMGIKKNVLKLERKVPIGPFSDGSVRGLKVRQLRGNPHTADELVVLLPVNSTVGPWPVRSREVFIRGKVRHVDHETVSFSSWKKVIRNNEPNQGQALGVGWVD